MDVTIIGAVNQLLVIKLKMGTGSRASTTVLQMKCLTFRKDRGTKS